jgi:hypothetical protein
MSNVCIVALSTGLLSLGAIAENASAIAPDEQAKWFVFAQSRNRQLLDGCSRSHQQSVYEYV